MEVLRVEAADLRPSIARILEAEAPEAAAARVDPAALEEEAAARVDPAALEEEAAAREDPAAPGAPEDKAAAEPNTRSRSRSLERRPA